MPTVIDGIDELRAATGRHLGFSDWLEIDQARIDEYLDPAATAALAGSR